MTYRPRASCKRCGIRRDTGVHISRGGNCPACGEAAMVDNLRDLHGHRGAYWLHYLDGLTAAVARLWGETLASEALQSVTDQDQLPEETPWPPGYSPHPESPTIPSCTSS